MKIQVTVQRIYQSIMYSLLLLAATFSTLMANAQEVTKKIDVDISTDNGTSFFASPWVWVVGGAVFILLLVALLRGGGRKEA